MNIVYLVLDTSKSDYQSCMDWAEREFGALYPSNRLDVMTCQDESETIIKLVHKKELPDFSCIAKIYQRDGVLTLRDYIENSPKWSIS